MRNRIILISKDAMGKFYLPIYGNSYWKTPNIDCLAKKGTVFNRHYTAAPSSAMSYTSMFVGVDPMHTMRKDWRPVKNEKFENTLFDKATKQGYKCHIIWDKKWMTTAKLYSECYGSETIFNPIENFQQCVGAHFPHKGILVPNEKKSTNALNVLLDEIKNIIEEEEKTFIWLHFPHVINGRTCYGSDIDLFDEAIGRIREYFPDDSIYITADHGNMNGAKGKICYGFDVYDEAACIPLITPRIDQEETVGWATSNVDLYSIIFEQKIPKREFVYSDSAYYAQPNRKLAIVSGKYKYIYSNKKRKEELYDLDYDPYETVNLMSDKLYDIDRKLKTPLRELYFYPEWNQIPEVRAKMREEWKRVWRKPTLWEKIEGGFITAAKNIYKKVRLLVRKIKK